MDRAPSSEPAGSRRDPDGSIGSVYLTRFRIHPDRRSDMIDLARSTDAAPPRRADSHRLLVELEDGDWLDVTIVGARELDIDDAAYLTLAEGILGEEYGAIIANAAVRFRQEA